MRHNRRVALGATRLAPFMRHELVGWERPSTFIGELGVAGNDAVRSRGQTR